MSMDRRGVQKNGKIDSELALCVFPFPMLHSKNIKMSSGDPWEVLPVERSFSGNDHNFTFCQAQSQRQLTHPDKYQNKSKQVVGRQNQVER